MDGVYGYLDCKTLYKAAKLAFDGGDFQHAHRLFYLLIENYPGTHEADYAYGFIARIKAGGVASPFTNAEGKPIQPDYLFLEFKGNAREYFRIWIVNLCLTLLTAGIFSAWAKVRKKRYFYSNLTLDGTPFQYLAKPLPILKGRVIAAMLFILYYSSRHLFTAMLPYVLGASLVVAPWVIVRSAAFNARYSAYRNMTFHFRGNYLKALRVVTAWGIIPAIAIGTMFNWWGKYWAAAIFYILFGILFPSWMKRFKQFIVSNTSFGGQIGQFSATAGQFFKVYVMAGLIVVAVGVVAAVCVGIAYFTKRDLSYLPYIIIVISYTGYVLAFAHVKANITNTVWNHTSLGPLRFQSWLRSRDLAKLYLTNALGIIASAGLLIPWAVIRTLRYRADHTRVMVEDALSIFRGSEATSVQAVGSEIGEFFDMDLSL